MLYRSTPAIQAPRFVVGGIDDHLAVDDRREALGAIRDRSAAGTRRVFDKTMVGKGPESLVHGEGSAPTIRFERGCRYINPPIPQGDDDFHELGVKKVGLVNRDESGAGVDVPEYFQSRFDDHGRVGLTCVRDHGVVRETDIDRVLDGEYRRSGGGDASE